VARQDEGAFLIKYREGEDAVTVGLLSQKHGVLIDRFFNESLSARDSHILLEDIPYYPVVPVSAGQFAVFSKEAGPFIIGHNADNDSGAPNLLMKTDSQQYQDFFHRGQGESYTEISGILKIDATIGPGVYQILTFEGLKVLTFTPNSDVGAPKFFPISDAWDTSKLENCFPKDGETRTLKGEDASEFTVQFMALKRLENGFFIQHEIVPYTFDGAKQIKFNVPPAAKSRDWKDLRVIYAEDVAKQNIDEFKSEFPPYSLEWFYDLPEDHPSVFFMRHPDGMRPKILFVQIPGDTRRYGLVIDLGVGI